MGSLSGYEITVLSDSAAVSALLAGGDLLRTPFQSSRWFDVWFAVLQPSGMDCSVGVIRRAGDHRPLFVLPLVRERRYGLTVLTLPDHGISDYQAALVSPDFAPDPETMDRLWSALVAMLPAADLISLERVPPDFAARMHLAHRMRPSCCSSHEIPIDADFATLRERRFDPSTGRRLVKNRRKLEHKGKLTFEIVSGADAIPDLERLIDWRRQRFESVNDPEKAAIQSVFYHRLIEEGSLACIGLLRLDGELLAGCLGLVDGGRFLALLLAYNTEFANWAPGLLMVESCIAASVENGLTVFDLTIGDETYKDLFGADTIGLRELHQPLTLRGRLVLALLDGKPKLKCALGKLGLLNVARRVRDRLKS